MPRANAGYEDLGRDHITAVSRILAVGGGNFLFPGGEPASFFKRHDGWCRGERAGAIVGGNSSCCRALI
jgi:hypothetical protein